MARGQSKSLPGQLMEL